MIFIVKNSEGGFLRSGVCQEMDLASQAGPGETVAESTEGEVGQLRQALAPAEETLPVQELPGAEKPPQLPPVDNWTVLIRALKREGITLDLDAARAELFGEIATKRTQSAAVRR